MAALGAFAATGDEGRAGRIRLLPMEIPIRTGTKIKVDELEVMERPRHGPPNSYTSLGQVLDVEEKAGDALIRSEKSEIIGKEKDLSVPLRHMKKAGGYGRRTSWKTSRWQAGNAGSRVEHRPWRTRCRWALDLQRRRTRRGTDFVQLSFSILTQTVI
ncbi:hypothetical protein LXL04_004165 [Taraxacum kok-saghyz]